MREAVNRDYIMNNGNKIDLLAADFDTSNCILKTIRWNKASIKTLLVTDPSLIVRFLIQAFIFCRLSILFPHKE